MAEHSFESVKVLIVKDDEFSQQLLAKLLEKLGFSVVAVAENGREGLEKLAVENVDLVICDIEMPEMDGFQFARRVRYGLVPEAKDVPILMLTGQDTDKNVRKGRIHKIDGFIVKPPTVPALQQHMTRVLRQA